MLLAAGAGVAARCADATAATDATSALDRLLGRRRMVRRFKPDDVDAATVRRLIAAALRAPSAGHTQPVGFVVVRQPERRAALGRASFGQTFVGDAPVVLIVCADVSRSRPRYRERAERYGIIDGAFASMCLLLAVVEAGLGACFVGAFDDAAVARIGELPSHVLPVAVVPIGHPAEAPRPMKLRAVADVVHEERW